MIRIKLRGGDVFTLEGGVVELQNLARDILQARHQHIALFVNKKVGEVYEPFAWFFADELSSMVVIEQPEGLHVPAGRIGLPN